MPAANPTHDACYEEVLTSLFAFLLRGGATRSDIQRLAARAMRDAEAISKRPSVENADAKAMSSALHRWYRHPRYLDECSKPKPLPLLGAAPSVAALVRTQGLGSKSDGVTLEMRRLKLIRRRRDGKYLPVDRVATIRKLSPALVAHIATSVTRLLATVASNTGQQTHQPLIERTAFVSDLAPSELAAFRKFSQAQGTAFLANVDEWLEARRVSGRRSPPVKTSACAGVHLYAFDQF